MKSTNERITAAKSFLYQQSKLTEHSNLIHQYELAESSRFLRLKFG